MKSGRIFAKKSFMSRFILFCFVVIVLSASSCKNEPAEDVPVKETTTRSLFYGKVVYSSEAISSDTVLVNSLNMFTPHTIEVYFDSTHFRMIEYGGLSHGNIIIDKMLKEVWQLDTAKKLAHLGEYSDLSDPSSALKSTLPDHYAPLVEKTNDTLTICGYVCEKYKVVRSGFIPEKDSAYIWVAKDIRFPSCRFDIQTEINHAVVPPPLYIGFEEGAILKLEVNSKNYTRIVEVKSLNENMFPQGIFEIPDNYQKK
jgi:hypothetical protein